MEVIYLSSDDDDGSEEERRPLRTAGPSPADSGSSSSRHGPLCPDTPDSTPERQIDTSSTQKAGWKVSAGAPWGPPPAASCSIPQQAPSSAASWKGKGREVSLAAFADDGSDVERTGGFVDDSDDELALRPPIHTSGVSTSRTLTATTSRRRARSTSSEVIIVDPPSTSSDLQASTSSSARSKPNPSPSKSPLKSEEAKPAYKLQTARKSTGKRKARRGVPQQRAVSPELTADLALASPVTHPGRQHLGWAEDGEDDDEYLPGTPHLTSLFRSSKASTSRSVEPLKGTTQVDHSEIATTPKRPRRSVKPVSYAVPLPEGFPVSSSPREEGPITLSTAWRLTLPGSLKHSNAESPDAWHHMQASLPCSKRSLTGPSLAGDFPLDLRRTYLRATDRPSAPSDTALFQAMINEQVPTHHPGAPRVTLCPPEDGRAPFSPPLTLLYTNRVLYPSTLVPVQAPGCACRGRCNDPANRDSCSCRLRQIAASAFPRHASGTKDPQGRSNHQGFAYDARGKLVGEVLEENEPIVECNSACGCSSDCLNKTAGNGPKVPIDIFWTGDRGWGVRVAHAERGGVVLRAGTPIGVYAGELLSSQMADSRETGSRTGVKRSYLFDIDFWHITQDIDASRGVQSLATAQGLHDKGGGRRRRKSAGGAKLPAASVSLDDEVEPTSYEPEWTVDATKFGNFTRFCNHNCDPNATCRAVYIDDDLITRPLMCFVARRDIEPGEEINISYFANWEPTLQEGERVRDFVDAADVRRERAAPGSRCHCGYILCRGVMFQDALEEDEKLRFL